MELSSRSYNLGPEPYSSNQVASSETRNRPAPRVRVSRACDRCKKRKIRCTGIQPCDICIRAAASCLYSAPHHRGRQPPAVRQQTSWARAQRNRNGEDQDWNANAGLRPAYPQPPLPILPSEAASGSASASAPAPASIPNGSSAQEPANTMMTTEPPSRASPVPPLEDLQGHYVGPASGVSFLLRIQKQLHYNDRTWSNFTFGDAPLPEFDPTCCVMMSKEETTRLLERYFDFTVPMDRFLHRPTLENWLTEFHDTMGAMRKNEHAPARRAVLWMVFALAQEHMSQGSSPTNDEKSIRYFLAADYQLSREMGAVSLSSIQARLCQCLWLLSQSRMNHCWQLFGSAARLALAIGLHRCRRIDPTSAYNKVELESGRRTFWNAYCLDNYLSIVLGRPRIFHDEDIDQELPSATDDDNLHADRELSMSNYAYSKMLAPIAYFRLSRIISMILRDLYSIKPLSTADRCSLAAKFSESLETWRADIPRFLNAENKDVAPLIPIFQRQRNVLSLAYWHTIILTHRPFLLSNFAHLNHHSWKRRASPYQTQIENSIDRCLQAAMRIVDTVDQLIQSGQIFRSFWLTSYFTFSAGIVLYVYSIQHKGSNTARLHECFAAATRCQAQLSSLAELGSLLARYCLVLEELRKEALSATNNQHPPTSSIEMGGAGIAEGSNTTNNQLHGVVSDQMAFSDALGDVADFQSSPESSLADIASWLQFESIAVSGFGALGFDPTGTLG